MNAIPLSKSLFLKGLQCDKALWLARHAPHLQPPPDPVRQDLQETGREVGVLARDLFPEGFALAVGESRRESLLQKTREALRSGAGTLYEPAFESNGAWFRADILHRGKNGWELYEVKATTGIKPLHLEDVAFQFHVLEGCGLEVSQVCVVHLNPQYIRRGPLELGKLFQPVDCTREVRRKQDDLRNRIQAMQAVLEGPPPAVDIGPHCTDPRDCDFRFHCWSHVPAYSVFNLNRLSGSRKFDLYRRGILRLEDLPGDVPLSPGQRMQVEAEREGKRFIDRPRLRDFLRSFTPPLSFLDFETVQYAIPPFDGVRPYQQIPFQFSLHVQEGQADSLRHVEFLAAEGTDPRRALAERLAASVPETGSVVVYNSGFEKEILRGLARQVPACAHPLRRIHDRVVDLMVPFQKKIVYRREMKGRYSIKTVLPALVPELNYDSLDIPDGQSASRAYRQLTRMNREEERKTVRNQLLAYCRMDTLGLERLWQALKTLVEDAGDGKGAD